VHVVPDFLDAALCARLRAAAGAAERSAAPVLKGGIPTVDERARRVVRVAMPARESALVLDRLEAVQSALEQRFGEGALAWDGVQFLVYRPGDYFLQHRDRSAEPGNELTLRRRIAVVVFLNGAAEAARPGAETFEGGALTFYGLLDDSRLREAGYPLRAAPGLLVAFRPSVLHEVTPVRRGERYTIVAWLVERNPAPATTPVG
jgi:predicted 2-oxoglutarate/Fe(II)-dependent dioxygenase YbiX